MIEACRLNPRIGGIMVHALTGGDWVVGVGLLDLFGEPKQSYYGTRKAFEPRYIAITPSLPNLVAGEDLEIALRGVNDLGKVAGRLTVTLTDSAGTTVTALDSTPVEMPSGIAPLAGCSVRTVDLRGTCMVRATLHPGDNAASGTAEPLASNEHGIYVMEAYEFQPSEIAILDGSGGLRDYAEAAGYEIREFSDELTTGIPLFVSGVHPTDTMRDVAAWVDAGGRAVILDLPAGEIIPHTVGHRQTVRDYLPFEVVYMQGHDLWSPSSHVARDHAVLAGLPTGVIMDTPFGEIAPRRSIVSHRADWVVAAVFYHYYGRQSHKQNYQGVSAADYGTDLVPVTYGRGEFWLCTLRIAHTITTDRFAQRLLHNLAGWLQR
jgi:hypothetical protein